MLKLFFGLIFVFFEFRIGGLDVLLNPVGYILVIAGLCQYPDTVYFKKAKPFSVILVLASCAEFFVFGLQRKSDSFVGAVYGLISVLFLLALILFIDKGVAEIEWKTEKQLNADKLMKVFKYQATLTVAGSAAIFVISEIWIHIILTVSAMISHIFYLYYIYKTHKLLQCGAAEDKNEEETHQI